MSLPGREPDDSFSDGWLPPSSYVEEPYSPPSVEPYYPPPAIEPYYPPPPAEPYSPPPPMEPSYESASEQMRETPPSGSELGYTQEDTDEMLARRAYEEQRRGERSPGPAPVDQAAARTAALGGRRNFYGADVGGSAVSIGTRALNAGTAAFNRLTIEADRAVPGPGQGLLAYEYDRMVASGAAPDEAAIQVMERYGEAARKLQEDPNAGAGSRAVAGASRLLGLAQNITAPAPLPGGASLPIGLGLVKGLSKGGIEKAVAELGFKSVKEAADALENPEVLRELAAQFGKKNVDEFRTAVRGASEEGDDELMSQLRASLAAAKAGPKALKDAQDVASAGAQAAQDVDRLAQKVAILQEKGVKVLTQGNDVVTESGSRVWSTTSAREAQEIADAINGGKQAVLPKATSVDDIARAADEAVESGALGKMTPKEVPSEQARAAETMWEALNSRDLGRIQDAWGTLQKSGASDDVMARTAKAVREMKLEVTTRGADEAVAAVARAGDGRVVESFSQEAVDAGARAADEATAAGKSSDLVRSDEVGAMRNEARTEAFAKAIPSENTMRLLRGEAQNAGDVARGAPILKGVAPQEVNTLVKAMREAGATEDEIARYIGQKPPKRADLDAAMGGGGGPRVPKDPGDAVKLADEQPGRWEKFLDVWNVPKTVKAAFDLSAPLRQGAMLTLGHPTEWAKAWKPMVHALVSEDFARSVNEELLKTNRGRLYIAPLDGRLAAREEMFMSRFVEKIPVIGGGVRASNRAYVTFLNKLRADVYDNAIAGWEKAGKPATDAELKTLQDWVNHSTGRGDLPQFIERNKNLSATLSSLFFSPRYVVSRFQAVQDATSLLKDRDNRAAQMAAADLVKFVGGVAGVTIGLATLAGGEVESDPRSSLFGKARFGDTTLDFAAGELQVVRTVAQALTGQRKSLSGKQEGEIVSESRGAVIWRFTESKLAPTTGLAYNLGAEEMAKGGTKLPGHSPISKRERAEAGDDPLDQPIARDYVGEAFSPKDVPGMLAIPLFPQDLIEAIQADQRRGGSGAAGAAMGLLAGFGVGVSTRTTDRESGAGGTPASSGKKRVVPLR